MLTFWILAALAVSSALAMVANRNPVRSALFLVGNLLTIAVLYLTLSAQFVAAVQVVVYAGAIMVLFLFVIMLLNLGSPEGLRERGVLTRWVGLGVGALLLTIVAAAGVLRVPHAAAPGASAIAEKSGTVESIGLALFDAGKPWLFPFELTSIVLLVGIVGCVALAKRKA